MDERRMALILWMIYSLFGCYLQRTECTYPVCSAREQRQYVTNYPHGTATGNCSAVCKTNPYNTTFFAVRKDGPLSVNARCYCVDSPPEDNVCGCDWKCGAQPCGGIASRYSVYTVCGEGMYGPPCKTPCAGDCSEGVCDFVSGHCPWGCGDGYHGNRCELQCSQNSARNKCNQQDAKCDGGCKDGWYSPHCTLPCSEHCVVGACGVQNGTCNGGCQPGWYTLQCTEPCLEECIHGCDVYTGECVCENIDSNNLPVWVWPVQVLSVVIGAVVGNLITHYIPRWKQDKTSNTSTTAQNGDVSSYENHWVSTQNDTLDQGRETLRDGDVTDPGYEELEERQERGPRVYNSLEA